MIGQRTVLAALEIEKDTFGIQIRVDSKDLVSFDWLRVLKSIRLK
jgi:hypothetical protein